MLGSLVFEPKEKNPLNKNTTIECWVDVELFLSWNFEEKKVPDFATFDWYNNDRCDTGRICTLDLQASMEPCSKKNAKLPSDPCAKLRIYHILTVS